MSKRYGDVNETVVISYDSGCDPLEHDGCDNNHGNHGNACKTAARAPCLRVMAWVERKEESKDVEAEWRLLRFVLEKIDALDQQRLGPRFRKLVYFAHDERGLANPVDVTPGLSEVPEDEEYINFEFDDGHVEDVQRSHVLPGGALPLQQPLPGRKRTFGSRMPQLDPALRERFRANGLSAEVCEQVCSDLGVDSLADLKDVEARDVSGLKLKPVQANKLLKLVQEAKKEPPC